MNEFSGFPRDFFRFFRELAANNERPWFEANKARYRESVVAPMMAFIEAMAPRLEEISPHYRAIARPHGGSMFRIYRDTRFSKDKTPYKTHAGCHFRHELGRDAHAPGFYAHFENRRLYFGGGIWRPPSKELGLIRHFIADNPAAWRRIVNDDEVQARGGLQGDQLKRPPRGFDPGHEHIEDLKRKSFYVMTGARQSLAYSPELLDAVTDAFRATRPLSHFICDALEVPF
jgi:uncharacterized protein (TIGR02453 family)